MSFFNDTATTDIYTLSLHDALPISRGDKEYKARHILVEKEPEANEIIAQLKKGTKFEDLAKQSKDPGSKDKRSEEHTSELQSLRHLVCRLLLEKKKKTKNRSHSTVQ